MLSEEELIHTFRKLADRIVDAQIGTCVPEGSSQAAKSVQFAR